MYALLVAFAFKRMHVQGETNINMESAAPEQLLSVDL